MKENMELEREDMYVDRDLQLDSENRQQIVAYLETLFDVNKKFNLQIDSEASEWVNMYGIYNPLSDFLTVECVICKDDSSESFFYSPTKAEAELIKNMIAEKIKEVYDQTPTEFVCDLSHQEVKAYLYYNRTGCEPRPMSAKFNRLKEYCQENGYTVDGSTSINAPMSRSGGELRNIVEYCKARGIARIVVDEMKDVADTPWETARILNYLQDNGMTLDVAHCEMVFGQQNQQGNESDEMKFGGMKMTQYIYPQNLKATANLWLWSLRDFCIIGIAALLSVVMLVHMHFFIPAAVTLCYGFLTIRMDETTMLDYMKYAVKYLISTQQYFEWR